MRIQNKNNPPSKNNRISEEKKDKNYGRVTFHKMNPITAARNLSNFQQAEKPFQTSTLQNHKEIFLNKQAKSNNKSNCKN